MKLRFLSLALSMTFFAGTAIAQISETDKLKTTLSTENKDTVAWIHGGTAILGLNQGFLHNWPAGGELGALTINSLFSTYAHRYCRRHIWSNNLDLAYGLYYAYSNQFVPRKTDDRIDLTSKYGYRLHPKEDFYLAGLFNFKSQFTPGYDYNAPSWDTFTTSRFFSPAYITLAAGVEYRRGNNLSLFFSPLAARMTFVSRDYTRRVPEGAFGVEYDKTTRFELGAYFSGRYQVDISKTLFFKTRLDLYANYLAKDKKDNTGKVVKKDNPGNIDLFWDNLLALKVNKLMNITLGATLVYDNDVPYYNTYVDESGVTQPKDEPAEGLGWWQVKQIMTIGLQYKF